MTALKATPYQGRCFTPLKLIPTLKAAQRGVARAAAAAVGVPPRSLDQCQAWDLLSCHTAGGGQEFLEVLEGWDGSCATVLWKGQQLRAAADGSLPAGTWRLTPLGVYPSPDSLVVRSFPEMGQVLPAMQAQAGTPPASVAGVEVVGSLDGLVAAVEQDASFWCDGLAPGGPVKTAQQQAVFTAGEIAALLAGRRGVAIVQLFNGWDRDKGQPVYTPFALPLLERALAAPGVGFVGSVAPGGAGLTAVLHADREPFASWAAHLASFGCQANVVAGSAYYKLLIGHLLGYKPANVLGYAESAEAVSRELQKQVEDDIRGLSRVKARLPWSADDPPPTTKPAKKPKAPAAGGKGGKGFAAGKATVRSR